MKLSRSFLLAVLVGAITALLPVILAIYLSWVTALGKESDRLSSLGKQIIERTDHVFRSVSATLHSLADPPAQACSASHIAELRRLTINSLTIEEIGYVNDGMLRCTSWGVTAIQVKQGPHDFVTQDGLAVVANIAPVVTGGRPVMAFRVGRYNALTNPERIVDFLIERSLSLAVFHNSGTLVAARGSAAAEFGKHVQNGTPQSPSYSRLLSVTVEDGEWRAVLAEPSTTARVPFVQQLFLFGPFGLIMGGAMGGLVYWLARKRLSPASELALAVKRREFAVHYQPILDLRTGACVGAEALVRRRKPDGSLTGPDTFLPLAEAAGLTPAIASLVIENIIADLRRLLESNKNLHLSVNFSAAHVQSGGALDLLETRLRSTRIEPSQIWLEVTERTLMELEPARIAIERARALGYQVLIDDFGTGYSSLQYLSGLPVTGLKIDKSFVEAIGKAAATSSVIPAITQMAKTLGLVMIGEGVENEGQVEYLIQHGVDYAQGWLYAKAMPAPEFIAFLRRNAA